MEDKKYVVLYGCSEGMGLTYHLTDMAIAPVAKMARQVERMDAEQPEIGVCFCGRSIVKRKY